MNSPPHPSRPPSWKPRFTLTTMLLVVLVSAMTAAGGRYLVEAVRGSVSSRATFVIAVLVLPMVLLVGANLVRIVAQMYVRARRKRTR